MWYYFICINVLSYLIMWLDKVKAVYGWWRISEKTLWILAILGGAWGIFFGMRAPIYHKAGKSRFRWWIPIIAALWTALFLYLDKI